jgi:putative transposon-encoded protein
MMVTLKKTADSTAFTAKPGSDGNTRQAEFRIFGEEMIEKTVKSSGKTGRIYLPPEWVGKHVKIIRRD